MDATIRFARILHGSLLAAALLYVFMAERLNSAREPKSDSVMYMAVAIMVAAVIVITFVFRLRMIGSSEEKLRLDSSDAAALLRWRTGTIVSLALAESVVLYGLVLRFVGATTAQAVPFYLAGIAMLLLFTPRRP